MTAALYVVGVLTAFGAGLYVGTKVATKYCKYCERLRWLRATLFQNVVKDIDSGRYDERTAISIDSLAMLDDSSPKQIYAEANDRLTEDKRKTHRTVEELAIEEFGKALNGEVVAPEDLNVAGAARAIEQKVS